MSRRHLVLANALLAVSSFTVAADSTASGAAARFTEEDAIRLEQRARAAAVADRGEEAASLAARALLIRERLFGADDEKTAPALEMLGLAQAAAGWPEEAVWTLERALKLRARSLGEDHPALAADLFQIAQAQLRLGVEDDAAQRLLRARALLEKREPPRRSELAEVIGMLALVRMRQDRLAEAEGRAEEALALRSGDGSDDRPPLPAVLALDGVALARWRRGEVARAEQLYRRVAALSEQAYGAAHPDYAVSLLNLGTVFYETGRLKAAEHLYRRALAMLESAVEPGDHRLSMALVRLSALCSDLGRAGEAAALQKRLARASRKQNPTRSRQAPGTPFGAFSAEHASLAAREDRDR